MGALARRLWYPALFIHVVGALTGTGLKRALIIHLWGHSLDYLQWGVSECFVLGTNGDPIVHGKYKGYSSLPALDYAVLKAGLLKLMPAFAEEAAPLDNAQGTQAYDPLFSQQGKQMPLLAEAVCLHELPCRAEQSP